MHNIISGPEPRENSGAIIIISINYLKGGKSKGYVKVFSMRRRGSHSQAEGQERVNLLENALLGLESSKSAQSHLFGLIWLSVLNQS